MVWEPKGPRTRRQAAKDYAIGALELALGGAIAYGIARCAPEWYGMHDPATGAALPIAAVAGSAGLVTHGLERIFNRSYVKEHEHDYGARHFESLLRRHGPKLAAFGRRYAQPSHA